MEAMALSLCPATGFMMQDERKKFKSLHSNFNMYRIPCMWFTNLVAQARQDSCIRDDVALCLLMDQLKLYWAKRSMLFHYNWVSIPLLYTQVVTIAFCLIRRQFLEPLELGQEGNLDMYIPLHTLLQFFFYAGWLKVADQIINPFGEDADDFETETCMWVLPQADVVSLLSMDDTYQNLPPAVKDKYWNEPMAQPRHTMAAAAETLKPSVLGSTFDMRMGEDAEQSQPAEASPSVPRIQTPLLSHFFATASPTISVKNFGWGSRGYPHLQCPLVDGGFPSPCPNHSKDHESMACIEEETGDEESGASKPPMPAGCLGGNRPLEASKMWRNELPLIQVKAPSSDNIRADQPEAWKP
ncbi:LOW QUALITY PROTEIN: bestrophin-4 [Pluvialis apricaria]